MLATAIIVMRLEIASDRGGIGMSFLQRFESGNEADKKLAHTVGADGLR